MHLPNHLPSDSLVDIQTFTTNFMNGMSIGYQVWNKPPGVGMVNILALGGGGGGGNGVVGAASTAAGGGGGGGSTTCCVTVPAHLLPDVLYIWVGQGGAPNAAGQVTEVTVGADVTANSRLCYAPGGNQGGNAAGAVAGAGATAAGIPSISNCPLAGLGNYTFNSGTAGVIGGTTVAAANLALPTAGQFCTGGAGGGGLPAAATLGTKGGDLTGAGVFPTLPGGVGGSGTTTPAANGSNGIRPVTKLGYWMGGAGGGSTHGSATGAGLVAGQGGAGDIGSGGGGGGGGLTGSVQGKGGSGGSGIVVITAW